MGSWPPAFKWMVRVIAIAISIVLARPASALSASSISTASLASGSAFDIHETARIQPRWVPKISARAEHPRAPAPPLAPALAAAFPTEARGELGVRHPVSTGIGRSPLRKHVPRMNSDDPPRS